MKHMKKLAAVLVSVLMSFAMMTTVFAEEKTYKLTLTGTTTGHTYDAYQIFTGDLSSKDGAKVLSNVKWGTGVTYNGTESAADVAKALGDNTMSIETLEDNLTLTTPVKTVESSKDSTEIDGLVAGYYLVKDKNGTQADKSDAYTKFIVQVVGDTTADIKSGVPTVAKKVKDTNDSTGETSGWQDSADYDINDWVPYQITGTMTSKIADYATYKYTFTDTMSKGLTYDKADPDHKAKITIGTTDVTGSFEEKVTNNPDGTTTVTWACDNLKGITGVTVDANTTVVVTYSAKLNKNAVIGAAGNPNTVYLTFSNNPNKGGEEETGKTPTDKNIVFTYKTVVNKFDQDKKSLAGAAFKLEKKLADGTADGTYKEIKSFKAGDETTFEFTGLDDGDYRLTEITTPAGYNTITPIKFTISATHDETADEPTLLTLSGDAPSGTAKFTADKDTGSLTTDVVNKKGATLPSTGGIGTTMFYVAGGLMVVVAGVLLAAKKKAEAK